MLYGMLALRDGVPLGGAPMAGPKVWLTWLLSISTVAGLPAAACENGNNFTNVVPLPLTFWLSVKVTWNRSPRKLFWIECCPDRSLMPTTTSMSVGDSAY